MESLEQQDKKLQETLLRLVDCLKRNNCEQEGTPIAKKILDLIKKGKCEFTTRNEQAKRLELEANRIAERSTLVLRELQLEAESIIDQLLAS